VANDTSRRPWALDTASIITTDKVRVNGMRWVSKSSTAGDDLSVEDNNGEVVWESVANVTNNYVEEVVFNPPRDFDGFELAVIDSGTLYVYYS